MENTTSNTLQDNDTLMQIQEEDLKKIEEIKEFIGQPNDDNLTNPTQFMSFSG